MNIRFKIDADLVGLLITAVVFLLLVLLYYQLSQMEREKERLEQELKRANKRIVVLEATCGLMQKCLPE